jgi:hypothetical protein
LEEKLEEMIAKQVLKEAKTIFDIHIEYWLNFGALLGAVRNGRFISYDDDIELNAWSHKVTELQMEKISRDLCENGFNVYYSTLTDYISIRKHSIPIAFSLFTLEDDYAWRPHESINGSIIPSFFYLLSELLARTRAGKINLESISSFKKCGIIAGVTATRIIPGKHRRNLAIKLRKISAKMGGDYGKIRIPAEFYNDLGDLIFYGETFKVPRSTEKYLEFIYGPDWRIPIKDWKYHDSDKKSITSIQFVDEQWNYK